MSYTFKAYVIGDREYFTWSEGYEKNGQEKKAFAFPQSLLDFLYLDTDKFSTLAKIAGASVRALCDGAGEEEARRHADAIRDGLDAIAGEHVWFELPRLAWRDRLDKFIAGGCEDSAWMQEINNLPQDIRIEQERLKTLFHDVLDILAARDMTLQQRLTKYYGRPPAEVYQFRPLTISYESAGEEGFADVLYPQSIHDLISFTVCACLQRGQLFRVCKSCGRYFALTGYSNTEYCDRLFQDTGKTCKEVGAVKVYWNKIVTDPVISLYNRVYKKRFARIRSGRLSRDDFYAWSEQARVMRDRCLAGEISIDELERWLAD